MILEKETRMEKRLKKVLFSWHILLVVILALVLFAPLMSALPATPAITYMSNTTYVTNLTNRSDVKGTITTIILDGTQQDYKWKAYVGNASGTLALADANGLAVYDWSLGTAAGEVYVSTHSNINWNTIACVNQASVDSEQTIVGMASTSRDSINATFNFTNHVAFNVGTTPISGCRSTATYINGAAQAMGPAASFQEILLRDTSGYLVYATLINDNTLGYNNQRYDFQLIVAENESATTPTPYFFWLELG
jgi:hypothetical protein